MSMLNKLAAQLWKKAVIQRKTKIAAHTWRVDMHPIEVYDHVAGEHLRIAVGYPNVIDISNLMRSYSVWGYGGASEILTMAVCTFSNGPGTAWVERVAPGDTVFFNQEV
ncbi:MAG: hypothetical protein ACKO96_01700, partial [Flammeovirgaceae bacterium]